MNGNVVKHLGFKLGEEHYAVPILTVREIIWGCWTSPPCRARPDPSRA